MALLTLANGGLTNTHNSTCAPYYEPFYYNKTVNDYSGATHNEYFGSHGAVIFAGGGHAATNDNSVSALVLGPLSCTFKRLTSPSPLFGDTTDSQTKGNNSAAFGGYARDDNYFEYSVDGQPQSAHSYGAGDVIGPNEGGAAHGSFIRVIEGAGGRIGVNGAGTCHQLDFNDTAGPFLWARRTNNLLAASSNRLLGPQWTAHLASQQRIYIETRAATAAVPVTWFDLRSNTYVTGTGAKRTNNGDSTDTGVMFAVPERELVVFADRYNGKLRIHALDVSKAEPGWALMNIDSPVPLMVDWSVACWCPDNNRIIVGGLLSDSAAICELEIPNTISGPWIPTRVAFNIGQTIDFAPRVTYKKWTYNRKVRAIVYMPYAAGPNDGSDTVYVYRPRNT